MNPEVLEVVETKAKKPRGISMRKFLRQRAQEFLNTLAPKQFYPDDLQVVKMSRGGYKITEKGWQLLKHK